MATPQEKLAASLNTLKALQDRGVVAIRTADLLRSDRERLVQNGFLQEVMKGWYIPGRPDETAGESTAWFSSYWAFCAAYLRERFGTNWCLSPEQSLSLHVGNQAVPTQLVVRSPKARNRPTPLPYDTSVFDVRATVPEDRDIEEKNDLRLFALPAALTACSPNYFEHHAIDARIALATVRDASDVLDRLLEGGHSTIAGRLAGAFRNIGRDRIADDIVEAMRAAGYTVRENDPFLSKIDLNLPRREMSPFAGRIRLMWQQMRDVVIDRFPDSPGRSNDRAGYLKEVEDVYVTDAYHSLSIEGYRVSPDLIERVRSGNWNPDDDARDRQHRDALAARGYWQAFQSVEASLDRVLRGENPGEVAEEDHGTWYRELFAPSVAAGLLRAADLAGYRNGPVFIRRAMHVPPGREAVRDAMPVLFELLAAETAPAVRVVLGHFIFVYIHPYADGKACLHCHTLAGQQIHKTTHWTWQLFNEKTGQMLGMKNVVNNAFMSVSSNEPFCTRCHIGFDWTDESFDFSSEEQIDCLVCHDTTGTYGLKKMHLRRAVCTTCHVAYDAKKVAAAVQMPNFSDLAKKVGRPTRASCGSCHFQSDGGDGVKHGDLDSSLVNAPRELDVHMATDGLNYGCVTCHERRLEGSAKSQSYGNKRVPAIRTMLLRAIEQLPVASRQRIADGLFGRVSFTAECVGSGGCVGVCPTGAIHRAGGARRSPIFNEELCVACKSCEAFCRNHGVVSAEGEQALSHNRRSAPSPAGISLAIG